MISLKPTKIVLKNGLTVIAAEHHFSDVISAHAWIKAGARNEDDKNNGISHFIEHLLFKGTEKRKVGEIDREIEFRGGEINAATSQDFTYYHITMKAKFVDTALDVLLDAMSNSAFDPAEIEKERMVILEEIRRQDDNPQASLWRLMAKTAFKEHPYRRPVLGTMETISAMTRDMILDYYHKYYRPENMTLVVVGDFKTDDMVKKIKKEFEGFRRESPVPGEMSFKEPPQKEIRQIEETRAIQRTYMNLGWHGPAISDPDTYAMDLLVSILGSGKSSRLYQKIKEEAGLVSSIGAGYLSQRDAGMIAIYTQLSDEKTKETQEAILKEIEKLRKELVTKDEIDKALTLIEASYAFGHETTDGLAHSYGASETIFNLDYELNYMLNVKKVSREKIKEVANKYLGFDNYSVVVLKPQ